MESNTRHLLPVLLMIMLLFSASTLWAGNFEKGTELLMYNKPVDAAPYLERAIIEDPTNANAYNRLAIAYEQLKLYDKALAALRSAMDRNFGKKAEMYGRMAKLMSLKGDMDECIRYDNLALQEDPAYSPVILNRANAWFRKDNLDNALLDYQQFISVDPGNPLKPDVVRMIQNILDLKETRLAAKKAEEDRLAASKKAEDERLAAEKKAAEAKALADKQAEDARLAAEAARKKEEELQKKIAEEKRKQDEAIRLAAEAAQKKILDDLFSSLSDAANEQKTLSAGAEDVQNKQSDLQLEE